MTTTTALANRPATLLRLALLVLLLAALCVPMTVPGLAHADTGNPPTHLDTLGGPGAAEMYPSGLEVGPDGSIVVADTGANQVLKYAPDGTLLWARGTTGKGDAELLNPRDIGIDSANNIYVADTGNARISVYAPDGTWLTAWRGDPADKIKSPIGVTVDNDQVIVSDGAARKVRVLDTAGNPLQVLTESPGCTFSAVRDADRDAAGNFYIANYTEKNVLKLSPTGACILAWGTDGTGAGEFKNPYGVAIAVDPVLGRELVYVNDSNNGRNQVFELDGTYVGQMGALGDPANPGKYAHSRRVAVATDGSGDVWIADLWGWKVERFARTPTGWNHAQTIGGTPPGFTENSVFLEPRGAVVDGDGYLWVADTVHHRFVRMAVDGTLLTACGERRFDPGGYNWPRDLAVDEATGQLWSADTKQSRLQVFETDCTPLHVLGGFGSAVDRTNWPMGIAIRQTDRIAFVADTRNDRVVAWDVATRSPITAYTGAGAGTTLNYPQGVEVDPVSGNVLVADTRNDRVVELSFDGVGFAFVREIGAGLLDPEGVAVDDQGRVFVADTGNDRVVVYTSAGVEEATITGPGAGFDAPASVAVGVGRLFVSDTGGNEVQVYAYGTPPPPTPPPVQNLPTYVGDFAGPAQAEITPVDVTSSPTHHYLFDVARYRVVRVNRATGAIDATAGGSYLQQPYGFAAARAIARASTGDVYVADTVRNRITRLDANLGLLDYWGTTGDGNGEFRQVYGIAIGQGKGPGGALTEIIYTVDGGGPGGIGRIQKFTLDGIYIGEFAQGFAFNQPRMVEVHPTSNELYVVNARAKEVVVFDVDGNLRTRFGSAGSGPGQFVNDARGIAIAPDGSKVYVSDDGNRRIQVFDSDGTYLSELGTPGQGTGWDIDEPRGLHVASDGTLVFSDQWAHTLVEWASDGTHLRNLFGTDAPVGGVNAPRGLDVNGVTGRVYNSDWWNQRIARWDADGTNPVAWGERGTRAEIGSINFAWDVAVQDGTGWVYVANRESHEVEVFDHDGNYVTRWGDRGSSPGRFEFPQGVAFDPTDGTLLVADSGNDRINRYSIDGLGNGTFVTSYGGTGAALGQLDFPTGVDVAPDGTIWVADTRNDRVAKRAPDGTWSAWTTPPGMSAADHFRGPWGVTVAPNGTIWVADTRSERLVKMLADGTFVWEADGDALGAGTMSAPFDVLFLPGNRVLVSDVWNSRIIELSANEGVPTVVGGTTASPYVPDTQDPDASITSPTMNEVLEPGTITFTGTATDDVAVDNVQVAIRDRDTNQWWRADGSWGAYQHHAATLSGAAQANPTWSYDWTGGTREGRYAVLVRTEDVNGKLDPTKPSVRFVVEAAAVPDTTAPVADVTEPVHRSVVPNGPVTLTGPVSDDVGVDRVTVGIRDTATGTWLRSDGSWGGYEALDTQVGQVGATSTTWTYTFTPPATGGDYGFGVKAYDAAGNLGRAPWTRFEVDPATADTTAPTHTVAAPTEGATYPNAVLAMSGTAADDVGVDRVTIAVRDLGTGQWYRADGSWGAFQNQLATLVAGQGATSTDWTHDWTPPVGGGEFGVLVRAWDAADNRSSKSWIKITVQG